MITVFRKEMKYIIPLELFFRLQKQLDGVMKRDIYGEDGTYKVRSQYYDSLMDQDLGDNLSGVMEKRKIRLRVYTAEDERVKLEYKCKSGSDGVKYSLSISREEAKQMEQGRYEFLLERGEKLALQLYHRLVCGGYQPKSLIEYDRTAFAYPVSDVRVTFDHRVRACASPYGFLEKDPFFVTVMEEDVGVLEVKYNDFLPSPIKTIIKGVDGQVQASSKYSRARLSYL